MLSHVDLFFSTSAVQHVGQQFEHYINRSAFFYYCYTDLPSCPLFHEISKSFVLELLNGQTRLEQLVVSLMKITCSAP